MTGHEYHLLFDDKVMVKEAESHPGCHEVWIKDRDIKLKLPKDESEVKPVYGPFEYMPKRFRKKL